jgi:hypothetical protein
VDKGNGFCLGGADFTRGPARRWAPFDIAHSSERTDEQELRLHGDDTQRGSQGRGQLWAGAEEASNAFRGKVWRNITT